MRIVHSADIHLDTAYSRREDQLRRRLQEAGREAFSALVDLAIYEQADVLVIAGDLFDNPHLSIATEKLLSEELRRLISSKVQIVYATGNHDPGRPKYRARQIAWPETRFHLASTRVPVTIKIERNGDIAGWVVAAGHETPRDTENLAAAFPQPPGPQPAVALVHAHVGSTRKILGHEPYAPAGPADFEGKGYAYWALGHIHARQTITEEPLVVYPGNLQGRDFGETGAKGALVVDIEPGATPLYRFEPLARVRWENLPVHELADARSITEIQSAAHDAFDTLVAKAKSENELRPDQEWILRVDLQGPCPLVDTLRREEESDELSDYLREELGALDVEVLTTGLHRPIDLAEHRDQQHVLGIALELADLAMSDDAMLQRLMPTDLAPTDIDPVDRNCYLRGLLKGLDMHAAEALLREDPA